MATFKIVRELGHGRCGNVFLVGTTDKEKPFKAAKICHTPGSDERFEDEISILKKITTRNNKCDNIVSFFKSTTYNGKITIILEQEAGDLNKLLADMYNKPTNPSSDDLGKLIWKTLTQMSDALLHLKEYGIIHRDIKPGNILITKGTLKLADFSHSWKPKTNTSQYPTDYNGITAYNSPESYRQKSQDEKSDLFELFATILEILDYANFQKIKSHDLRAVLTYQCKAVRNLPNILLGSDHNKEIRFIVPLMGIGSKKQRVDITNLKILVERGQEKGQKTSNYKNIKSHYQSIIRNLAKKDHEDIIENAIIKAETKEEARNKQPEEKEFANLMSTMSMSRSHSNGSGSQHSAKLYTKADVPHMANSMVPDQIQGPQDTYYFRSSYEGTSYEDPYLDQQDYETGNFADPYGQNSYAGPSTVRAPEVGNNAYTMENGTTVTTDSNNRRIFDITTRPGDDKTHPKEKGKGKGKGKQRR
ncbi:hypothetical protein B7494_g7546 [Chlorociboria aeruginascens]|nr:hypothetical protein B7494_g7546 [Chlorociboria aeruginascens]